MPDFESVDLQVNGVAGIDFSSLNLQLDDVMRAASLLKDRGTMAFCPTLVTTSFKTYMRNLPIISQAMSISSNDPDFASIIGIHLEGPWLSPMDGARGVHPKEHIIDASISILDKFFDAAGGNVLLLTIAPEIPGGLELIAHAVSLGVNVSLGHTLAEERVIREAVSAGARFSTHLGNGIPQMIHRHENPIWSQLAQPELVPMLIADGHHLPFVFIQAVIAAKGDRNVIVVSDASPAAGMPPGNYTYFGATARLDESGKLYDQASGYLAGSSATLKDCAKWLEEQGLEPDLIRNLISRNAIHHLAIVL